MAGYGWASLEPFDWQVPSRLVNGVVAADGWRFENAGIIIAQVPDQNLGDAAKLESLDVSLEVRPQSASQSGPARILTISRDPHRRNLTLGQEDHDLVVRLRSEDTSGNGLLRGRPVARLGGVFEAGRWVSIDLHLRPGEVTIEIDGARAFAAPLPPSVISSWNPGYDLALGNERTCNRPWLGDIRKAVISWPNGAVDYAEIGHGVAPETCQIWRHPPRLVPLTPFNPDDIKRNLLMYIPLGCLLGLLFGGFGIMAFVTRVAAIASISFTFEFAQLFLVSRVPAIDDLMCNILGGAFGIVVGLLLRERLAPVRGNRIPG